MKRLSYAGESFLTADAVADEVVRLVAALGGGHGPEALEIPAVTPGGGTVLVQLVVGPASQLVSVPEQETLDEPETTDVVSRLRERVTVLRSARAVPVPRAWTSDALGWDDLDQG
ncbi:hypothetical protein [Glaciibacter superstes]|uniref:hypothetical protein n=1 Tax=Glaciibacter superstes TaxID=501023 RepID=UPI0003B73E39|nr:hypothetical protein [Glaciibacter superstes]